jgi:ATP-dependent Clp protease ATP-binding subunit ClpX
MASKDDDIPPLPTPEEITRRLSEFMKSNFGDAVSFTSSVMPGFTGTPGQPFATQEDDTPETETKAIDKSIFDFDLTPREVKTHLDRYVIRQEEAKKVLSIAVCDHYNHAKFLRRLEKADPEKARQVEFAKQNVIIVGPTGVGKTYLVKHIADLIGVPFVKADATKFSETGYVGADVDDLVRELVRKADGDVELAEYGIIYIDEVDKIASQGGTGGRDVSGRGVQTTLLKLMEETEVPLRGGNDIQSQMQAMFDMSRGRVPSRESVNTRHILFIVSGAFSGLDKIVNRRTRQGAIGFAGESREIVGERDLLHRTETQDFIEFGFEAEFIGRLPVRVVCDHLEAGDLYDIMKHSEGSLIRQYEREFEAYGIRTEFRDEALRKIAARAETEKTGARGLMTVCERLFRDFKFELPGTAVTDLVIDAPLFDDPAAALARLRENGSILADSKVMSELSTFRRQFAEEHGVRLAFDSGAIAAIVAESRRRDIGALAVCRERFRDYQFGLKLIQRNTGQEAFTLPGEAITDPDGYLSGLVVASYAGRSARDDGSVKAEDRPPEGKAFAEDPADRMPEPRPSPVDRPEPGGSA